MSRTAKFPSTKELRAFETVARLGSIKAAADYLAVSPSALSRRIQALEEDLGQALFHRESRGISLTDVGRLYAARLSTVFSSLSEATEAARIGGPHKLRILAPGLFAQFIMHGLKYFEESYPGVQLTLDIFPGALGSDPRIDDSDVVILYGEPPWEGWDSLFLTPNGYGMPVCAPGYLPGGMVNDPRELAKYTWIQLPYFPEVWNRWCAAAGCPGLQPRRYFEVNSGTMAREAALSGLGIWVNGSVVGAPPDCDLLNGRLVLAHSFHAFQFNFGFYLAHRPQSAANPLVPAFRDWMSARFLNLSTAKSA